MLPVLPFSVLHDFGVGHLPLIFGVNHLVLGSLIILLNREQVIRLVVSEQYSHAFKSEEFRKNAPAVDYVVGEAALGRDD